MLFKLFETFSNYVYTYMQLEDKFSDIKVSCCLKGIIPLIGFTIWLYYTKNLFQCLCVMSLLYFVIIVFYDIRKIKDKFPRVVIIKGNFLILKECFPIMLASLIAPFMLFLTRHTVEKVFGTTELGFYSAFTMVIVVFSTMAGAVYLVLIPSISEKYNKRLKNDIIRIIFIILGINILFALIVLFLVCLIGDFIFSFVFGAEILNYMYLLPPVIFTSIMFTLMSFSSVCLTAMQKGFPMLIGLLAGAAFLSIFIMPATRSYGMLGTTNTFTISLCVIILIHGFVIFRKLCSLA